MLLRNNGGTLQLELLNKSNKAIHHLPQRLFNTLGGGGGSGSSLDHD